MHGPVMASRRHHTFPTDTLTQKKYIFFVMSLRWCTDNVWWRRFNFYEDYVQRYKKWTFPECQSNAIISPIRTCNSIGAHVPQMSHKPDKSIRFCNAFYGTIATISKGQGLVVRSIVFQACLSTGDSSIAQSAKLVVVTVFAPNHEYHWVPGLIPSLLSLSFVEAMWPCGKDSGFQPRGREFETQSGRIVCVLGQCTLSALLQSTKLYQWVRANRWEVTCHGLASHPGKYHSHLLHAKETWDKLQYYGSSERIYFFFSLCFSWRSEIQVTSTSSFKDILIIII